MRHRVLGNLVGHDFPTDRVRMARNIAVMLTPANPVSRVSAFPTRPHAYRKIARFCLIGLLIATCVGCGKKGPQRAAVSGHVTLDGQPINEGVIQFLPVEGTVGPETGAVITNGQYDIPHERGPIVGKSRIELRASKKTGGKIQDPTGRPGVLTDEYKEMFPPSSNTNSSLVREIKDEPNKLDFDIRTKSL
jgi:hypothetical protein